MTQRERRLHILQGEFYVSADPNVMLATTLGSCVAACIRDPVARVGGMNYFLLPDGAGRIDAEAARYGAYAMELLINGLLQIGAMRHRLEAKLFGGAHLFDRLTNVGEMNAAFAEDFLNRESILLIGGSVRGAHARKLQYWPVSGRVRQMQLTSADEVFAQEQIIAPATSGSVELF